MNKFYFCNKKSVCSNLNGLLKIIIKLRFTNFSNKSSLQYAINWNIFESKYKLYTETILICFKSCGKCMLKRFYLSGKNIRFSTKNTSVWL